ncbi:MAG: hypothetical protein ACPL7K_05505, partial [Armatimonadota bacterium]
SADPQQSQRKRKRLDAVLEVLALLDAEPTVETASERISEIICRNTSARSAILCLRDGLSHDLRKKKRDNPVAAAVEGGRVTCCAPEQVDPAVRALMPEANSFTLVPMLRSDCSSGAIVVGAAEPLSEDDIDFVSTVARLAACVLPILQTDVSHLAKLKRAVTALSRLGVNANLDAVRDTAVQTAAEALETDLVALFTIDPVSGGVECRRTSGVSESLCAAFWERFGHLAIDREQEEACLVHQADQGSAGDTKNQALEDCGVRTVLACPTRPESGTSGVLAAFYTSAGEPADIRAVILESIAVQTSAAISYVLALEQSRCLLDDLAGANRELSVQATCDGLTGLPNHRSLQQKLSELCARSSSNPDRRVFSVA